MLAIDLKGKANYIQKLKDCLRHRFRVEYLGNIRETQKVHDTREINVGDLVFIGSDDSKRIDWPLGKIIATIKGKDGCVRVCRIKTQNGELVRPIQRLYPLELECKITDEFDAMSKESIKCKRSEISDKPVRKLESISNAPRADNVEPNQYVTRNGRVVQKKYHM